MPDYLVMFSVPKHGTVGDWVVTTDVPMNANHITPLRKLLTQKSNQQEIVPGVRRAEVTEADITLTGVFLLMKGDDDHIVFKEKKDV